MNGEQEELNVSKVEPYIPKYDKHGDLIREQKYINDAARKADNEVLIFNKGLFMDNKAKAIITAVIACLVQVVKAIWGFDIPPVIFDAITGVLVFIAGLFLPQPKQ